MKKCLLILLVIFVIANFSSRPFLAASNELFFLHTDHLGSTRVVTDQQGNKVASFDYYPYGLAIQPSNHLAIERLYTSQIKDSSTDLYFYNARYYNPTIGIFISPDSLQGPNRYSYVANNPINMVDPSGNQDEIYMPLIRKPAPDSSYWGDIEPTVVKGPEFAMYPFFRVVHNYYINPEYDPWLREFLETGSEAVMRNAQQEKEYLSLAVNYVYENVPYSDYSTFIRNVEESFYVPPKYGSARPLGIFAAGGSMYGKSSSSESFITTGRSIS